MAGGCANRYACYSLETLVFIYIDLDFEELEAVTM
jgi:hypothetical protein